MFKKLYWFLIMVLATLILVKRKQIFLALVGLGVILKENVEKNFSFLVSKGLESEKTN